MPRYTVRHNESGKTITFDWAGASAPTDKDFEEVFSEALKVTPAPKAKGISPEKFEERVWATAEQYGIPLEAARRLAKPETLSEHLALYTAKPEEAAKLATGSWPLPLGQAAKTVKAGIQKARESAAAREFVPKNAIEEFVVAQDLARAEKEIAKLPRRAIEAPPSSLPQALEKIEPQIVREPLPPEEIIETTIAKKPYQEPAKVVGEPEVPKGEISEEFARQRAAAALKTSGHLRTAEDLLAIKEMKPTWVKIPPRGAKGEVEVVVPEKKINWETWREADARAVEHGFYGWEGTYPGETRPALATAIRDISTGKVYATDNKVIHSVLADKVNTSMGVAWENMESGFVTKAGKFVSDPAEIKLLRQAEGLGIAGAEHLTAEELGSKIAQLQKLKTQAGGRAIPGLLPHLATTATGAGIGGALDKDNRLRGAVIGGATGFTMGLAAAKALLPRGQGLPKGSRLVKGGNVEIPPVEGQAPLPLTEPSLRYPPHRAVSTKATEQMIEKGILRDPNKDFYMQVMEEIHASPENFVEILKGYNVTPQQFGQMLGVNAPNWARKLGLLGQLSRKLMRATTPEEQQFLEGLGKQIAPTAWDHFHYWWGKVDNVRRALLVSQLSTAMRNIEVQVSRVGLDIFEQALNSGIQKLWGAAGGKVVGKVGVLDGLEPFMRLFAKNKAITSQILKAIPAGEERLLSRYMADISKGTDKGIEWVVNKINFFNRLQETLTRRAVFMGKLDQAVSKRGMDLHDIIAKNNLAAINEGDIKYALNEALEFTFAKQPKWGSIGQKFISLVNAVPTATWLLPFPRFMVNSLKFNFEYSPFGLLKLLSAGERAAFKAGNMQTISRATIGSAMLYTAWQMRNSEHAGEKWYQMHIPGWKEPMDFRPYNPLAGYLFVADIIKKLKNNELYKMTANDWVMGIAGTNFRAGVGLWTVDKILGAFSVFATDVRTEQAVSQVKQFLGETLGGIATPLNQIKEALYGFDDMIIRERKTEDPLLDPLLARVPYAEQKLPPAYAGTREEPIKTKWPIIRQATGFAFGTPKNELEKELDRLGFDRREWSGPLGEPSFDNLVRQKMGYMAEHFVVPMLQDPFYKEMTDAEKGYFLNELGKDIRQDAREWAASEEPETWQKIKEARIPKRERLLLKEHGLVR